MSIPERHQVPYGKVRLRSFQRRRCRQQLQLAQRPRGIRGDLLRQVDQFLGKLPNTRLVEQVTRVGEHTLNTFNSLSALNTPRLIGDIEAQIEVRAVVVPLAHGECRPG